MRPPRPMTNAHSRRRGVTLLEMLVTVALLLLMMITIVAIFQAATGAVSVSRAYTLLDQDLRRLDVTLRQDLAGVTCVMTPPNNPNQNGGYFEYAENALSDAQDEDSDDTLRFTAKAPDGRPFTGRIWVPKRVMPDTLTGGDPGYAVTPTPTSPGRAVTLVAGPRHEPVRGDHLLPARRQALSPRAPDPAHLQVGVDRQLPDAIPNLDPTHGPATGPDADRLSPPNLFEPFALFQNPRGSRSAASRSSPWQGLNDISSTSVELASDNDVSPPPLRSQAASIMPRSRTRWAT